MIDWSNCNEARQGWDLDLGEQVGEFPINIKIHHDTSYPFQSTADVSVWDSTRLQWNKVASLMWQEWAKSTGAPIPLYAGTTAGTEGIWDAAEELRCRAAALLLGDRALAY